MYREVKTPYVRPRIVPFSINSFGTGVPAQTFVTEQFSSTADGGVGVATVTLKNPFARTGICVGLGDQGGGAFNVGSNGAATFSGLTNLTSVPAGADSIWQGFFYGHDNASTSQSSPQTLKAQMLGATLIPGYIAGSASPTMVQGNADFSVTAQAAGAYNLTFKEPYGSPPIIVASACNQANARYSSIQVLTTVSGCRITTTDDTATGQHTDMNFLVLGSKYRSPFTIDPQPVLSTVRKPRILSFLITVTAGTPVITVGGKDAIISDLGAGSYRLTFLKPFAQPPIVLPTTSGNNTTWNVSRSNSQITFRVANFAGTLVDPGFINLIVFGSDDPSEYA